MKREKKAEKKQQQHSETNGTRNNDKGKTARKKQEAKTTRTQHKRGSPTTRICKYQTSAKCEHVDKIFIT